LLINIPRILFNIRVILMRLGQKQYDKDLNM
jgi:hypothetical protein